MRIIYLLIVLAVAILAMIFALQNSIQIVISFFSLSASGSLSLVLILTLSIGILLGVLIMAPSAFKRSLQFSGLKRKFSRLEREKAKLDNKVPASSLAPKGDDAETKETDPARAST
jgi:uncharacterized membrane protein YciS (DUF1049 family)